MKKFKTLLAVLLICLVLLSSTWQGVAASESKETKSYTIIDFILLSKHLVSEIPSYISDFDYNKDNDVTARDLVILKILILNPSYSPIVPDDDQDGPNLDDDGYYEDVRPIDEGHEREGVDKELIKKIAIIIGVLFVVIIACVALMYVL